MKMRYEKPVVEKQEFATVDVITTSPAGSEQTTIPNVDGGDD